MAVTTTQTNKPFNPRGNDQSPKGYNRAALYSGKALDFDGVNDRLDGGSIDALGTGDFSYSVYFNPDGFGTYHGLFAIGTIYNFGLLTRQTTGEIYAYSTTTDEINSGYFLKDGESQYITFVRSGTSHKFYINGVLFSDITDTAFYVSAGNYKIGQVTSFFANGQYSNARLFNTALTAAQVADLYNNPEKVVPTGVDNTALKLWLPMMEGAGTTAYDGSGNGNHGTISGATYVNGIGAPVAQSAVMDWNKTTNLLKYSEDQTNWTLEGNTNVTANALANPFDELLTADKVYPNTNNVDHYRGLDVGTYNGAVTSSIYVKADGYNFIDFGIYNYTGSAYLVRAVFNLSAESINFINGSIGAITSIGNGWYQIKITGTLGSSSSLGVYHRIRPNDGTSTYSGDGTSGAFLWGAQFMEGAEVVPYVRTGATAQTSEVLLPQGLTTGRDITGVNLFENVRKQGALNLDGNSWAEVHDNASLDVTTGLTLEAWVYWDATQADKGILGKWRGSDNLRGYLLYVQSSTEARFFVSSNGVDSYNVATSTTISNGWNHIIGTSDGSKIKIYLNGAFENEVSASTIFSSSLPLEIGRFKTDITAAYPNDIAQPRIYNRALTAEEVQRNYNAGKNTYTN